MLMHAGSGLQSVFFEGTRNVCLGYGAEHAVCEVLGLYTFPFLCSFLIALSRRLRSLGSVQAVPWPRVSMLSTALRGQEVAG